MKILPNWRLLSVGAFFAYIEYPMIIPSMKFSELLLKEVSVLVVPGSFFELKNKNNDQKIRIAIANDNENCLIELVRRLN